MASLIVMALKIVNMVWKKISMMLLELDDSGSSNGASNGSASAQAVKPIQQGGKYALSLSHEHDVNQLSIFVQNIASKEKYVGKFSIEELQKCGFTQSLSEVASLVHSAFDGNHDTLSLNMRLVPGERSCLVVTIFHDLKFFKQEYVLRLYKADESETEVLRQLIDDLQKDLTASKERIASLEKDVREPVVSVWTVRSLTSEGELQWEDGGDFNSKGQFELTNNDTNLTVKSPGVYRIHGAVCITNGKSYKVNVNGRTLWCGRNCNDYAKEEFGQKSKFDVTGNFDYMVRLDAGSNIRISAHGASFIPDANVLMVEKVF